VPHPSWLAGHIYWANERGTWYVFRPNPERFELVAENQLGDEGFSSPAAVGGELYIRAASREDNARQEFLYRLEKK
jgi:outer membrane protein assembly factor BamB